jgi:hypothetical protein
MALKVILGGNVIVDSTHLWAYADRFGNKSFSCKGKRSYSRKYFDCDAIWAHKTENYYPESQRNSCTCLKPSYAERLQAHYQLPSEPKLLHAILLVSYFSAFLMFSLSAVARGTEKPSVVPTPF